MSDNGTQRARLYDKAVQAVAAARERYRQCKQAAAKAHEEWQALAIDKRWGFYVNVLLFLAASAAVIFTACQLTLTRKQNAMTMEALRVGRNANKIARRTMMADSRAWVLLDDCNIPVVGHERGCKIKNWGGGPALNVLAGGRPIVQETAAPEPPPPHCDDPGTGIGSMTILGPGADRPAGVVGSDDQWRKVEANAGAIQDRQAFLFIIGRIAYRDMFEKPRCTQFCLRYEFTKGSTTGKLIACRGGNRAY